MGRPVLRLITSQTPIERPCAPSTSSPLAGLIPPGRLTELSAPAHGPGARTTTAVSVLAHAQRRGETAVWLQPRGGPLYPPDLADAGIDLDALVVVHVPVSSGPHGACKAAELLLRSGAFGLVVLDLSAGTPPGNGEAWQGRLLGLARQHHTQVLLLTEKNDTAPSLGPLVGVRIEPRRERVPVAEGTVRLRPPRGPSPRRFAVRHEVLKNKTGKPIDPKTEVHRGPWGL